MNIKTGVKFHNRFDIEIRDKDTGKLKQKAVAENIVLDRMYTRICNFNSYFSRIHFGTGTGDLSPSRTTLFSSLGNKSAVNEEKIKAYPVSKVTRRIRLEPEEYVGSIITEVGVSETTSAINTHALIKDAEGNPLSIEKTELDVVIIYATIFIELSDANDITFSKFTTNMLIDYFVDGTQMNPSLWLGDIGEPTEMGTIGYRIGDFPLTRSVDVANKKTSFSTRLGVDNANYDIRELSLGNICRIGLENAVAWQPFSLKDVQVGMGDGLKSEFDLVRYDATNVAVKVDGNTVSNYTLESATGDNKSYYPFWSLNKQGESVDPRTHVGYFVGIPQNYLREGTYEIGTLNVDPNAIVGEILEVSLYKTIRNGTMRIFVDVSSDGETFSTVYESNDPAINTPTTLTYEFTEPCSFVRLRLKNNGYDYGQRIEFIRWKNPNPQTPQIVFDNPPLADNLITADYTVPYIPKTSDYVLDIDFTLQFGEGL